MIPQRVKLKGLLCYRDEQTIGFEGSATVWMLSGLNGSGKSAIFDAVTYALFGYHRGGAQGAADLINKDSDTLVVEFDFLLDGRAYRVKRTLRRDSKGGARGTQQLFRHEEGKWSPVPGTEGKKDLERWVDQNIGLTYETFTSSVLLLQGKAEKLLDSAPSGRRAVLASIVDLGRYEKLHQRADEKKKALDGAVKALSARLNAIPQVDPLELGASRMRVTEAEEAREAARAEVERWQKVQSQALLWQDLQARLGQARARHQRATQLLAQPAAIEAAHARLCELREVLPRLSEVVISRGQAGQAVELLGKLAQEKHRKEEQRKEREAAHRKADRNRAELQARADRDSGELARLQSRLRELSAQVASLKEVEHAEAEVAQVDKELATLPARPEEEAAARREEVARLEEAARIAVALERLRARREELLQERKAFQQAESAMKECQARGEARKAEAERLRVEAEAASVTFRQAAEAAAAAQALAQQARQGLEELTEMAGARVCRLCAQPLTAEHYEEQRQDRERRWRQAEERLAQARREVEACRKAEANAQGRLSQAEQAYQAAREEWKEARTALDAARKGMEKAHRDCTAVYDELPEEAASRIAPRPVADWSATTWPEASDIAALRASASGLAQAKKKVQEAEAALKVHAALTDRKDRLQKTLKRHLAALPASREGIRAEHALLDAREKSLFKEIDALREALGKEAQEVTKLRSEADAAAREVMDAEKRERELELQREAALRNVGMLVKSLPEAWKGAAESTGMSELNQLREEHRQLEARGVEEQARELALARTGLEDLARSIGDLESQAEGYPPEARLPSEEVSRKLAEAVQACDQRDRELLEARGQVKAMEEHEARRAEALADLRIQERELVNYRLLAELLGRDKLQLHLVRQAERQVVEHANSVLDRLSGGNMFLRLSGEASGDSSQGKALELEVYNRATGERPINVAFLSGSQKFRVAVSLALGIGQYASRQHRPIESVIIDEGFGCLDSQGRQVMIQELQNLRSQMRCILLVSHQEDFAEAFPDGYQFRLENGATRVTRFQK
jgi:DNA repair exonuclease SbcCD ATPase subunit